jgi:adhesin/invasin
VGGAPLALAANGSTATPNAPFNPAATPSREGVGAPLAACFGTGKQITETVSPTPIIANGTSTSTATAHVTQLISGVQTPCVSQIVTFTSSDPKEKVGVTTNHGDGSYTAVITSSKKVGKATIVATTTEFVGSPPFPTIQASAVLTQVAGRATKITLAVSPASIPGNGTSTSTGTATLKDANGNAVAGSTVKFTSSDPAEKFSAVTGHANGTYTVTITSSAKAETATITATDTSVTPNIAAVAPLTQTAVAVPVPSTGSAASPAAVGFGLMALGLGLLTRARQLRGRASRSRRVEG